MVPGARVEVKQPSLVRSGAQGPAAAFWRLTQGKAREGKLLTLQGLIPFPTPISLVHFLLIGPDWTSS